MRTIQKINSSRFLGPRGVCISASRYESGLVRPVLVFENIPGGVEHKPLPPRFDLAKHSPTGLDLAKHSTGFEWGYGGSGPAQLALAVAAYCLGDERALECYHELKWGFFANLSQEPGPTWEIWSEDVVAFSDILETAGRAAANSFLNSLISSGSSQGGL